MSKEARRSGRKEAEGKAKMKKIGRYREAERGRRVEKDGGEREVVGAATPVS